jgi:uncharacterized membrane protein YciS (DUF1049 family)
MMLEESTGRWIDLLAAQRAEHLRRLHAFGRNAAFGALALAAVLLAAVVLGLEELWQVTFEGLELAGTLATASAILFAAGCALAALAVQQQRRDRSAAIAALDRAIPQLLSGAEPRAVLAELGERMRLIAPPRESAAPDPYLPSLAGRRAYTSLCLACAALVLAAVCLAGALVLAVPPDSDDEGDDSTPTPAACAPQPTLAAVAWGCELTSRESDRS